ncbi:tudor domain-containing protein 1 isoform X1 [Alligator sinensis]|uniref:Tudor domain-containing protein 1 n=1 Tax=Alligator sinensis TaxID=38654 RepID=A0A1U8DJ94_ALLSI|nr:tudor domain-containing protein 1 isoform X1 [Alligator sinensis]XP_025047923.1 tudor domain-containing protein 1 isoform X1 [Alligator sinensis]XP_025047924.1 tudor domain-containing protein 1 isoform X1 [Alligator sinensis]
MAQRFHKKSQENKMPTESLRSPFTYPNFLLKSPGLGGSYRLPNSNFFFCEQTKQFFACQNSPGSASTTSTIEMVNSFKQKEIGSEISGRMQTGNSVGTTSSKNSLVPSAGKVKSTVSSDFHRAKQKLHNSPENILSVNCDLKLHHPLVRFPRITTCHHCGLSGSLRCSQCKQTYYCSVDCQKKDWSSHVVVCKPVKKNFKKNEENAKPPGEIKKKVDFKGNLSPVDVVRTEDNIKKIMFSDLQDLALKKAMEIQGTVTEFRNPSEFYIQVYSPEVLEHIRTLTVKLKDCYANTVNEEEYVPARGEVCVAKYFLDQTWNRVLVKEVDIVQKKALVLYIDYGNEENASLLRIKQLHRDIDLFPPCAIKCSVANVPKEGSWNKDFTSIITPFMGEHCSVAIADVLQEEMMTCFAVDVVIPSSGKRLGNILLEMRSDLSPKRSNNEQMHSEKSTLLETDSEGNEGIMAENKRLDHNNHLTIKAITLSVGDRFSGIVSHIQNPEDFFCQQLHNGRELAELQATLCEYCNKIPSTSDFRPAVGDVCCAKFTEDNQWYRASIIAYISEDTALVGYIDYGNFETLQITRLRPVVPKLLELPMQAIKCTLAGVKPQLGTWPSEAISLMKQLVHNKVTTVRVMGKTDYSSVVEFTDESFTPINVSKHLIEAGYAMKESKALMTAHETSNIGKEGSGDTVRKGSWTWVKLALKQTINVIVCMLYSPGEFYCHMLNDDLNALNVLNKSLAEYCQQASATSFKPVRGEPCCAFFSGDGKWYRALVKDISSDGAVKVQFVDYGNVEEVTPDKLRQISFEFLKLPFQGIKCWLSGVKPVNKQWLPETIAQFQMYTAGIKLQASIISLTKNGAGLELIDNSTGCPRMISEMLICEQLTLKEVQTNKEVLVTKSADKKEWQETSSSEQWKTIKLPINKAISVRIVEVINPDLFYAVPSETKVDQDKLCTLMIELAEYCSSCSSQSFKPKVGEACCAKFSGDGHWYRAVALQVSPSDVKVVYGDYGNTETLRFSKVMPITACHLKLPFQIIKCSLAGIVQFDGDWSALVTDLPKRLASGKSVTIMVKGITENIHVVSVVKSFENGNLNVADGLVMGSLAKPSATGNPSILPQEHASETKCCCTELRKQIEKHEQILLFLLNKCVDQDGLSEMGKMLERKVCLT